MYDLVIFDELTYPSVIMYLFLAVRYRVPLSYLCFYLSVCPDTCLSSRTSIHIIIHMLGMD